jgi:acetyl esterase/lipase
MLRWLLLLLASISAVIGCLTVVKSPDWAPWTLAVFAGEFGHWLALLVLVIGGVAWGTRGGHGTLAGVTAVVSAVAMLMLLKPTMQALTVGRSLPGQLEQTFGPQNIGRPAFSVGAFFQSDPKPVRVETIAYSGDLMLDFYHPVRPDNRPAPCVLVVHGGGWDNGKRDEIAPFNHWLARHGYAVAAITYRLAPKFTWPAQRDDILAAVAFLKTQAAALGIDATRLVLLGRSAGGNLAEATAYSATDPAIRGVVALYAPADMIFAYAWARDDDVLKSPQLLRQFLGGTPETAPVAYSGASAYLHVNKTTPPTLLVHGELDTLVWNQQSVRLDKKLTEAGVPHTFVSLPWATHAIEYNLSGPGGQLTTFAVEWFLAAVTKAD